VPAPLTIRGIDAVRTLCLVPVACCGDGACSRGGAVARTSDPPGLSINRSLSVVHHINF
jgi:hypothetical protein